MNTKYTNEHEWIRLINEKEAYVGITDYAQSELGEIVFVEVSTLDETLNSMEVFGSIEAVKTVSDLHIPVAGKVLEVNTILDSQPELVNDRPEDEGWIIKIEVSDLEELNTLMSKEEYLEFIKK